VVHCCVIHHCGRRRMDCARRRSSNEYTVKYYNHYSTPLRPNAWHSYDEYTGSNTLLLLRRETRNAMSSLSISCIESQHHALCTFHEEQSLYYYYPIFIILLINSLFLIYLVLLTMMMLCRVTICKTLG
jgi:hypothetical protein